MRPVTARGVRPGLALLLVLCAGIGGAWAQGTSQRRGFSIKLTQPVNGDIAVGKTKISAEVRADNPSLVTQVEFFIGDMLIYRDTEAPWECTYDFGPQSIARVIRAVATHREGVTVSDIVVTRAIDMSFAVRVNRVLLNAVVTNHAGQFVRTLGPKDLIVKEEGVERTILEFSLETRPLSVALVLDTSGSMQERIEEARKGASAFIESLAAEDQAMVVDFADKVFLLQDMTSDRDAVRQAIQSISAVGATALYDAVHSTLRKLRPVDGRKALILLSDGGDTGSQFSRERVIEEAKAADVSVYAIGLGATGLDTSARSLLKEFSESTGGKTWFIKDADELTGVYHAITEDLRNQYFLSYESANEKFDGRWVPIDVGARSGEYEIRARPGYLAVKSGS